MKLSQIILTVFIAGLIGFVSAQYFTPSNSGEVTIQKESVYERVINSGKIRCGYFTWPPFLVKDPNTGVVSGLSAEYVEKLGDIIGVDIEWSAEIGVGDYIAALNADRIDMMCMTLWPDGGRLTQSLLSKPIFYSGVYAITRIDDNRFDSGFDAINKEDINVSVIDGDITQTIAEKKFSNAKQLEHPQLADLSYHFQALESGKADVMFQDIGSFEDYDKTNPGKLKLLKDLGPVHIFPETFGIKKGELEFKLLIDNAIDVMTGENFVYDALKTSNSSSYPSITPYDLQTETR